MDNLKIGFIGAGGFARHTLYPALHLAPVALQAVCDADEGRRLSAAGKFGTGRSYADWREMCGEEDIEALIICMGPDARQGLVKDALAAGYHVFTPKPPAPSLADTIELAEAAEAAGKTMMVNFQRRFSVGARQAKAISETPEFGGLSQIFCSFCSGKYGSVHHYLLDFAIHHFDLIRRLAGEPKTIASFGNERHGQGSFAVSMEFENGAVGLMQLNSQRLWRRNYDRIEMTGHESYIVLDGLWTISHYTAGGNTFTENYSDERNSELTGDSVSLTEFVRAVREEREPQCSIQDCVKTMRLYDAVLSRRRGLIEIG
ncbi:MAG: Gfo/Idh/MocA family oxidoreductase [Candidatus Poribacteria bacterium]|nr:Gfo/Idh/MocA family oxidoreductase [Candidatus Poribacteria bacterium]